MNERHTVTLRRRSDDREGPTFDVTGMSPREFDRLWDALVMKVDFAEWAPIYNPERGDDQTIAEWLTTVSSASAHDTKETHR